MPLYRPPASLATYAGYTAVRYTANRVGLSGVGCSPKQALLGVLGFFVVAATWEALVILALLLVPTVGSLKLALAIYAQVKQSKQAHADRVALAKARVATRITF